MAELPRVATVTGRAGPPWPSRRAADYYISQHWRVFPAGASRLLLPRLKVGAPSLCPACRLAGDDEAAGADAKQRRPGYAPAAGRGGPGAVHAEQLPERLGPLLFRRAAMCETARRPPDHDTATQGGQPGFR